MTLPLMLALLVLALAPAALADEQHAGAPSLPRSLASEHFVVHWSETGADAVSATAASALLPIAERAFAYETGELSFPPPRPDADAKTDIYVARVAGQSADAEGVTARDDNSGAPGTAWIALPPATVIADQQARVTIPHELLHVIAFGILSRPNRWLSEATANWASARINGDVFVEPGYTEAPLDPLDCFSCHAGGYKVWQFFESLARDHGADIVARVYQRHAEIGNSPEGPEGVQAIDFVLAGRGSSLTAAFNAYARRNLTGDYNQELVRSGAPPAYTREMLTGGQSAPDVQPLARFSQSVDHLAAAYVRFRPAPSRDCFDSRLRIGVDLPPGLATAPAVYSSVAPAKVQPLAIAGGKASIALPWTSCSLESEDDAEAVVEARLVLPNPSTSANGQIFAVSAVVERTGPRRAFAFTFTSRLPRLVRPARARPRMTLTARSSRAGTVQVWLGGKRLGTFRLRVGRNALRVALPRGLRARVYRLELRARAREDGAKRTLSGGVAIRPR